MCNVSISVQSILFFSNIASVDVRAFIGHQERKRLAYEDSIFVQPPEVHADVNNIHTLSASGHQFCRTYLPCRPTPQRGLNTDHGEQDILVYRMLCFEQL
jgi:hypothetical protein